ncbi:MAG: hypothetical protein DMG09_24900 [Acidobacteria bacterium]|nr:MAG: hypothetical protein DMG09_24900 [Acidobacteriota bacterium]
MQQSLIGRVIEKAGRSVLILVEALLPWHPGQRLRNEPATMPRRDDAVLSMHDTGEQAVF